MEEINLIHYLKVLWKRRALLLFVVLFFTLGCVLYSLTLPNLYRAHVTFLPVGGNESGGSGMMAIAMQLGLGGMPGSSFGSGSGKGQLEIMLRSQTLAERMIERHDLLKKFFGDQWDASAGRWKGGKPPSMESAVGVFFSIVKVFGDVSPMRVEAVHPDPEFAAEIANSYVRELSLFLSENAFSAAKVNRFFIETQLEKNKVELLESGKELTEFYALKGIPNADARVDVDVSVSFRPAVFETNLVGGEAANADTENLQGKADDLYKKIRQGNLVEDVPQQVYLQYLVLRRQTLGQLNALLSSQYEMAKIHESKEDLNFSVVDWARVPEGRFKPNRRQIVVIGFTAAVFFGIFIVFLMEYIQAIRTMYLKEKS